MTAICVRDGKARAVDPALRVALALTAFAGGTLASVGCGGSGGDAGPERCTVSCGLLSSPATLILSCGATDLANVAISGPCAAGDAATRSTLDSSNPQNLYVTSTGAGTCHVELTFATGFTYSTDVAFVSTTTTGGCCSGTGVNPTQSTFMVHDPSTTCVDAGLDVGVE
ncbi:MAG: hypothetical protein ACRENE_07180 [Polyangiaceae bacterium]